MTVREPSEPERWVVSTDAPPELRALLEVARREGPSLTQKVSLGRRLGLSLEQALVGLSAKGVAMGTIVLAATTGAAFGLYTAREAPVVVLAAPAPPESLPVREEVSPAPPAPPPSEAPVAPVVAPAPPSQTKRPTEAALIRAAREALPNRAGQARTLLERHRRFYPTGQLAQEREVLLIEVLELEGRQAEASARAAEFRQKNPDSAHRPKAP